MAATYLVTNAEALKRILWLHRESRVVISSPRLAQIERKRVQQRMNHFLGVSGYGVGLTAVVAMLVLSILWIGGHWKFFLAHWFPTVGLGASACLFAGAVGRTIGFLYARWRLVRLIRSTVADMDHSGADFQSISAQRAALLTRKTIAQ